jgi:hypothetical protein
VETGQTRPTRWLPSFFLGGFPEVNWRQDPPAGRGEKPPAGTVASASYLRRRGFSVVDGGSTQVVLWVVATPGLEPRLGHGPSATILAGREAGPPRLAGAGLVRASSSGGDGG